MRVRWLGIHEIRASLALRGFGALLAVTHVITYVFWKGVPSLLSQPPRSAVCWAFFEDCWRLHPMSERLIHGALIGYCALAVITTVLFLVPRCAAIAWAALLALTLGKLAIFVLDYRLMGNYHYMPFVVSFAYLFCRDKATVCRLLIIGFYISAGTLKLNIEWLSGAALLRPPFLTGWIGDVSLAYVVLLELVLVLGLLARHRWIVFATLGQLLFFHIYSWHIVGYFYPCIMFCVLGLFPLCELTGERPVALPLRRSTWLVLALYTAAQIAPVCFPGDSALTGEGRIFALNMLDAKSDCSLLMVTREGTVHTEHAVLRPNLGVRIRCEPLTYFETAQGICRELAPGGTLDLGLVGKRATGTWFQPLVSVADFCRRDLHVELWHHNDWIDP